MIRIVKMKKRDLGKVFKIGKQQFKRESWFSKKFLKDSYKRGCISLVALDEKEIIGCVMVDVLDKPKAWIFFFVVCKSHRKKGVGSQLLQKAEKMLPKDNNILFVDFEKKDHLAKSFYEKHGFKKQAWIKNWFGLGHKGLIYEKRLK